MSYSKETTIWCDGDDCQEWTQHSTSRVGKARTLAENNGWDCSSDHDLCKQCSGNGENRTEGGK